VLHGSLSYLLQDEGGQVAPAHSVSAGLDYPGVGPEHAWLRDTGRARYASVTDAEALDAFHRLARLEGIIPALESAHAVALYLREARTWRDAGPVVICLSGRGDKDVEQVAGLGDDAVN
jgi:tryptophan synthase beta chain